MGDYRIIKTLDSTLFFEVQKETNYAIFAVPGSVYKFISGTMYLRDPNNWKRYNSTFFPHQSIMGSDKYEDVVDILSKQLELP